MQTRNSYKNNRSINLLLLTLALIVGGLAGQDRIHSPSITLNPPATDVEAAFDSVFFYAEPLWAAKKLESVTADTATLSADTWQAGSWGRGYYTYHVDERSNQYAQWYSKKSSAHPLYRDVARLIMGYSAAYFSGLDDDLDSYDLLSTRVNTALRYLAEQEQLMDSTYIWWKYRHTLADPDSDDVNNGNGPNVIYNNLPYEGSVAIRALTEGYYLLDELGGYSSLKTQIEGVVRRVAYKLEEMPASVIANRNSSGGGANVNYRGLTIWALVGAYKLLDDDAFKTKAWDIAYSLLYPTDGSFLQADGSWQLAERDTNPDWYHDARINYHGITLRGFAELYTVLTNQSRKDTVLSAIIKNINHVMDYNGVADTCGHDAVRLVVNPNERTGSLYTWHICNDLYINPRTGVPDKHFAPTLITGLITARQAIRDDITGADVARIDALIEYLASRLAAKVIENRSSGIDSYLNTRQQKAHALGAYLDWKINALPPAAPVLRLRGSPGRHPQLNWTTDYAPDHDHFVVKKQYNSGTPTYITRYRSNYLDTDVLITSGIPMVAEYWVKAVDETDLSSPYSNMESANVLPLISKAIADAEILPAIYELHAAHPNPFNPVTTLRYDLPQASRIALTIYDIKGREVFTHAAVEEAGYRQLQWQGQDHSGQVVPSGVYVYRLLAIPAEGG